MYPEGPGYWHYGTNYHVMLLAACHPLGRPTADDPILRRAGAAIMHLRGPTGMVFNFADGNPKHGLPSPAQCWLAGRFKDPVQARHVRGCFSDALADGKGRPGGDRYFPLALLWLPGDPTAEEPPPNAAVFGGEQAVAVLRSGWEADAVWLGIKGGTPAASHGHMDVGSFVYEAHGQRWIHDLGSEDYNLPGYFGGKRWTYFRLQNRSHNTLEIDGKLQNPRAKPCPVVSSSVTGNPITATFDLTGIYAGSAGKVVRRAGMDTRSGVVTIADDITAPAGTVCWRAFTDAEAEVDGDTVTLRKNGGTVTLRRSSAAGEWSVTDAGPPTAVEKQNDGFRAVVLTIPRAARVAVVVEIRP